MKKRLILALCLLGGAVVAEVHVTAAGAAAPAGAANRKEPRPVEELRPLAEAGDAEAQCELGWRLASGEGAEKNPEEAAALFRGIFERSAATALSERYDMIVLDEVFDVINEGMLAEAEVFEFITNAPVSIEIVMTGHRPAQRFLDAADYVTEMKKIKHPYDRGLSGRIGIEF